MKLLVPFFLCLLTAIYAWQGTSTVHAVDINGIIMTLAPADTTNHINYLDLKLAADTSLGNDSDTASSTVTGDMTTNLRMNFSGNSRVPTITGLKFVEDTPGHLAMSNVGFNLSVGSWPLSFSESINTNNLLATARSIVTFGAVSGSTVAMVDHRFRFNGGSIAWSGTVSDSRDMAAKTLTVTPPAGSDGTLVVNSRTDNWTSSTYNITLQVPLIFNEEVTSGSVIGLSYAVNISGNNVGGVANKAGTIKTTGSFTNAFTTIAGYWDTATTANLQAGAGTWSSTATRWSVSPDGSSALLAWNGDGANTDAYFNPDGTSTIFVSGNVNVKSMTIGGTGYTFNSSNSSSKITSTTGNIIVNQDATINAILSGTAGLTKTGGATLTLSSLASTYTGPTVLTSGNMVVNTIGNGGSPSSIGASSADASNLQLNGGDSSFHYTGPDVVTDRGFIINNGTGFITDHNITFTGSVGANSGGIEKLGDGTLTFKGTTSPMNTFNGVINISKGPLALDGSNVTVNGWSNIGNGGTGSLTMNQGSTYTVGWFNVGIYGGTGSMELTGNAAVNATHAVNASAIGAGNSSTGSLTMRNTSNATITNSLLVGSNGGVGDLTVLDSAQLNVNTEFWVGVNSYTTTRHGSLTIGGTSSAAPAVVTAAGHLYVGLGGTVGNLTMSGTGELHLNPNATPENEHFGWDPDSIATVTMTGHSKIISSNVYVGYASGWFVFGDRGGTANVTLSDFASISIPTARLKIGGSYQGVAGGMCTMTLNDSAMVTAGTLVTMNEEGGNAQGILNLNGGVFSAPGIFGGINSQINFKGGVLQAGDDNADYLSGGGIAVKVSKNALTNLGAVIDTQSFAVTINTRLLHDAAGPTIDGGLMKIGSGTLLLTSAPAYTGNTDIQAGTLQFGLTTPGNVTLTTVTGSGTLSVCDGTTLTATSIQVGTLSIGGVPVTILPAPTVVPEPSALVLLALAGTSILLAAWRRK